MAVSLEPSNIRDPSIGAEIQALVEHHLNDRPGDWRVSIVGSRESNGWEMKVLGPNRFERSYTLVGSAGEHQPLMIGNILLRLLPAKMARGEWNLTSLSNAVNMSGDVTELGLRVVLKQRRINTLDLRSLGFCSVPNQVLYPAEPLPEVCMGA
jgi:hypothetical protein